MSRVELLAHQLEQHASTVHGSYEARLIREAASLLRRQHHTLHRYGKHDRDCHGNYSCTCGFHRETRNG